MIFVTVGTDGPFDRLVSVMDCWAQDTRRDDVFAQIGASTSPPRYISHTDFLGPQEFQRHLVSASLIVAHAGMGTILSALRHRRPLLVMPRRASLGEQRNEHQLATARYLLEQGRIAVAFDEHELLARLAMPETLTVGGAIGPAAQPQLIAAIQEFIHSPAPGARVWHSPPVDERP